MIPAIPGIASDKVVSVAQAEANPDALGERVVILGGGLVGCETGIHLGMKGKQVTIVEMRDTLAADVNMFHGMALGQELKQVCHRRHRRNRQSRDGWGTDLH